MPSPPIPRKPAAPEVEVGVLEDEEVHAIHVPRYHVVLFDDDDHSYEYVIEMLMALFGHGLRTAYDMASTVDRAGRVVVDTTTQERAQLKRDQIHAYGPDWRIPHCTGSMSADVEPAE
jgi:ATP-dependent Clp protease adaptor protein ClpS